MHDERGTGRVLNLVDPLPVGDDRSADDQATQREHDTGAAVLALGESVDRPDYSFQRLVNLGHTPALGHAKIVHHRGLVEHSFLAPLRCRMPSIAAKRMLGRPYFSCAG
jgi:hypothetical protein